MAQASSRPFVGVFTALVTPMRARREEYANNPELVEKILREGAEKARAKAQAKMKLVRERVGL
jgi:tryptophanyl-tRNA synthetase